MCRVLALVLLAVVVLTALPSLITVGADVWEVPPEFVILAGNGYVEFLDNIMLARFEWYSDMTLRLVNLTYRNTEPETVEIKLVNCNLTVTRFFEGATILAGRIYFTADVVEIIMRVRVVPTIIYVNGRVIDRVTDLQAYRTYPRTCFFADWYTGRVYVKIYRKDFTGASLATLFPIQQAEEVTIEMSTPALSGQVHYITPVILIPAVIVAAAIGILAIIKTYKNYITQTLHKLVNEVKE